MKLEEKIRAAIDDIANGNDLKNHVMHMLDPEFRTAFQFFFWLSTSKKDLFKDYYAGNKDAQIVVECCFQAWEARRSWEEFKKERDGVMHVTISKEHYEEAVNCIKDIEDKQEFVEKVKKKLATMGVPDYLTEETAVEFYKKMFKT